MVESLAAHTRGCLFFWVRHAERLDHKQDSTPHDPLPFKHDSPITEVGKQQAADAGLRIRQAIEEAGYSEVPIQYVVSPLLRTLQTAASDR